MTREMLNQYRNMHEELKTLKKEIVKAEDDIARLVEEGTVRDKVKGGYGGNQGFVVEGFPIPEYNRRKLLLKDKVVRLKKRENDLLEMSGEIERFIEEIPVSRDRLIFQKVYLEKKKQQTVADELFVDRSLISKIISKYLS